MVLLSNEELLAANAYLLLLLCCLRLHIIERLVVSCLGVNVASNPGTNVSWSSLPVGQRSLMVLLSQLWKDKWFSYCDEAKAETPALDLQLLTGTANLLEVLIKYMYKIIKDWKKELYF